MKTILVNSFILTSESEYAIYFKHEDKNIAVVKFKEDEFMSLRRAEEIVDTMESMMDVSKNCYSIVEADIGSELSSRARAFFAQADLYKEYKKGIAVVVKGLPQRIIYNLYLRFNKPTVKHQSFKSVENAITWLTSIGA